MSMYSCRTAQKQNKVSQWSDAISTGKEDFTVDLQDNLFSYYINLKLIPIKESLGQL